MDEPAGWRPSRSAYPSCSPWWVCHWQNSCIIINQNVSLLRCGGQGRWTSLWKLFSNHKQDLGITLPLLSLRLCPWSSLFLNIISPFRSEMYISPVCGRRTILKSAVRYSLFEKLLMSGLCITLFNSRNITFAKWYQFVKSFQTTIWCLCRISLLYHS